MKLKSLFRFGGQRARYWSCSRFASWITSTFGEYEKPCALELDEWRTWRIQRRREHPIVYWFVEKFLTNAQNTLHYPLDILDRIRSYVRNRFFDKIHYLPTRLEAGEYWDADTRLLHGMFETLVDFVETEKAYMFMWTAKKADRRLFPLTYRFPALRVFRWTSFRSREFGVKYLKWESSLTEEDCPGQATQAKEIIDLYTWWKDIRPTRIDPHNLPEWVQYCNDKRNQRADENSLLSYDERTPDEQVRVGEILDRMRNIEHEYDREDEEMMIRLVKIRKHLWT